MRYLMVKKITNKNLKQEIATKILFDLPEWFGIPEYTKDYIDDSVNQPFFAIYMDDLPIGFAYLQETSPYTLDIHCMGILKQYHHQGYGKELMKSIDSYAKRNHYKFLQVKTVQQGRYDTYDKTNAFYKSVGFYELEVFPTLWDAHNPCQVFVKSIY